MEPVKDERALAAIDIVHGELRRSAQQANPARAVSGEPGAGRSREEEGGLALALGADHVGQRLLPRLVHEVLAALGLLLRHLLLLDGRRVLGAERQVRLKGQGQAAG